MTSYRADLPDDQLKIPKQLPVLPLRDLVVYPFIIVPLSVSRERSLKAVDLALAENRMILLLTQKDSGVEEPAETDLYAIGTVAVIMRMLKLPDGRIRVLVQGVSRAKVEEFETGLPYLRARITRILEPAVAGPSLEQEALMRNVKKSLEKSASLGKSISSEVMVIASNLEDPGRLADLTASNLEMKVEDAQMILRIVEPLQRLRKVNEFLGKEIELLTMQQEINTHAREEIDKSQREYFLRQQLKAIQSELGEGNELAEEVEQYPGEGREGGNARSRSSKEVDRQVKKLERMHPDSAETATVRNYLDWMVSVPWCNQTKDNLDLEKARNILDEDHYGLENIKERILEYLAVRKLKTKMKGPILCFVRPAGRREDLPGQEPSPGPWAGNSSGCPWAACGTRRRSGGTGAPTSAPCPARSSRASTRSGPRIPVFMMDEVDKIGSDYRGDPSSALLEVLDPEQNVSFRDHYLDVPFDLSRVMFITTANLLDPIPSRLPGPDGESSTWPGYTEEEKLAHRPAAPDPRSSSRRTA